MQFRTLIVGYLLLLGVVLLGVDRIVAQPLPPAQPAAAVQPNPPFSVKEAALKSQLQEDEIKLAVQDFQLAQAAAQFAQERLAAAKEKALQTIEDVKQARGYDSSWQYNFQTQSFVHVQPASKSKEKK